MQALKTLPFFAAITDAELNALKGGCTIVELARGESIPTKQGQTDAYWFLLAGHWQVARRIQGVWHTMFDTDRVGTWTGGIAVIDAIAPVRATTHAPSQLIRVETTAMQHLVAANPQVARQLLNAVNWGSDHIGSLLEAG